METGSSAKNLNASSLSEATAAIARLDEAYGSIDKSWLDLARVYANQNAVNVNLADGLAHQLRWDAHRRQLRSYFAFKRFLDIAIAITGLIVLMPLLAFIAIAIKLNSPGPIFFTQVRIGRNTKPFTIYKFRTMKTGVKRFHSFLSSSSNSPHKAETNRVTSIGSILRRTSIDELPQLVNVIKGDMSIVGPRPLSIDDTLTVPEEYMMRFAAPPGLTGLWQSTVRNTPDGILKLRLDSQYVLQQGFALDLRIVFATVPVVLKGFTRKSR